MFTRNIIQANVVTGCMVGKSGLPRVVATLGSSVVRCSEGSSLSVQSGRKLAL